MPRRSVLLLLATIALLTLSVGFGSAVYLSGGGQSREEAGQAAGASGGPAANNGLSSGSNNLEPGMTALPQPQETDAVSQATPTEPEPTSTPVPPTMTPTVTETPTVTPTDTPYPTRPPERTGGPVLVPNNHKGVRWVSLQAGHWNNERLPDEFEHLRGSTGAYAAGVSEVDITVQVSKLAAQHLHSMGYSVEILDATVPPNYATDLFLSLHADGNRLTSLRGFKAVAPWGFRAVSDKFVGFFYEEYGKATGLPVDAKTSDAMANYYAFNPVRYRHALNPHIPAALIEMGFVTNQLDRQVLTEGQDSVAWGIANAVDRYFRSGAAGATPSPYPAFTHTVTPTATPTSSSTVTETGTATSTATATPLPPELALPPTATALAATPPTRTPLLPTATRTPSPTVTPLLPIVTADGRWFPPLSPNGRTLPQPGARAGWVLLGSAVEGVYTDYVSRAPGWRPYRWHQYYVPELGRSIWIKGSPVPMVE